MSWKFRPRAKANMVVAAVVTLITVGVINREYAIAAKSTEPPVAAAIPAVSNEPQTTTASFGDWVVRCVAVGTPAKRSCEASQSLVVENQGRQVPVAQIAFGTTSETGSAMQLTTLLPVNISFDKPVRIGPDDAKLVTLPLRRCIPAGCYASAQPEPDMMSALKTAAKPGRLVFTDAGENTLTMSFSLRGLAQALDSLGRER